MAKFRGTYRLWVKETVRRESCLWLILGRIIVSAHCMLNLKNLVSSIPLSSSLVLMCWSPINMLLWFLTLFQWRKIKKGVWRSEGLGFFSFPLTRISPANGIHLKAPSPHKLYSWALSTVVHFLVTVSVACRWDNLQYYLVSSQGLEPVCKVNTVLIYHFPLFLQEITCKLIVSQSALISRLAVLFSNPLSILFSCHLSHFHNL